MISAEQIQRAAEFNAIFNAMPGTTAEKVARVSAWLSCSEIHVYKYRMTAGSRWDKTKPISKDAEYIPQAKLDLLKMKIEIEKNL